MIEIVLAAEAASEHTTASEVGACASAELGHDVALDVDLDLEED